MSQGQIVECVPNFSEGRDTEKIERIVAPLKEREQVRLVNYEGDRDYNRLVVTVLGEPRAVKEAILDAIGVATELIDLNHHEGEHLRMGATDVVPLIPIRNMTIEDTVLLSKELAREINERYQIPVFLYEDSAANPGRVNLAHIRRGQFEGMAEKLLLPEWEPDFGEEKSIPPPVSPPWAPDFHSSPITLTSAPMTSTLRTKSQKASASQAAASSISRPAAWS